MDEFPAKENEFVMSPLIISAAIVLPSCLSLDDEEDVSLTINCVPSLGYSAVFPLKALR